MTALVGRTGDVVLGHAANLGVVAFVAVISIAQTTTNGPWTGPLPQPLLVGGALLAVLLWLALHHLSITQAAARARVGLTVCLVGVTLVLAHGSQWMMPSLALAAIALLGRRAMRWSAAPTLLAVAVAVAPRAESPQLVVALPLVCCLLALVLVSVTRMLWTVEDLAASRKALVELRVDQERRRMDRKLQAVLGAALSTAQSRAQQAVDTWDHGLEASRAHLEAVIESTIDGQARLRRLLAQGQLPPAPDSVAADDGPIRRDGALARTTITTLIGLSMVLGILQSFFQLPAAEAGSWPLAAGCVVASILWFCLDRLSIRREAPLVQLVLAVALLGLTAALGAASVTSVVCLGVAGLWMVHTRLRWPLLVLGQAAFVTGVLLQGWVLSAHRPVPLDVLILVVIADLPALALVATLRMRSLVDELVASREELARLRVGEERLRIHRDLHDLLGRTLVAVSLRSQTALRLLDRDPDAARGQLDETVALARAGREQLLHLVGTGSLVGLDQELASTEQLCRRIGVDLEVAREAVDDPSTQDLVARVVREATTNMFKHAHPGSASVRIRQLADATTVEVVNDGVPGELPDRVPGTGLADLARRVESLPGARFVAGPLSGGRFRVAASIPADMGGPRV